MADQQNTIKTVVQLDVNKAERDIVKLNSAASDSTKTLEERIEAKNKQIKIQQQLSKVTIENLTKERRTLEGKGASEKELMAIFIKLNKAKKDAVRVNENNTKSLNKLTDASSKSKSGFNKLDKATGGLLTKFKLLASNPIGLIFIAIAAAVKLLTTAINSSEEGQNKMAKASAILGSILGNLMDVVSELANILFDAFSDPEAAIKKLGELIKQNLKNRLDGLLELIPKLGTALMQLFSGDFKEAAITAGDAVGKIALGVDSLSDSINNAAEALKRFSKEAQEDAKKAAAIADKRALADKVERQLIIDKAKAERDIAALRDIAAKKDSVSAEERKAAIQEAADINQRITDQEIAAAKLRYSALVSENKLSNSNKEALDAEANAAAKIINLESQKLKLQKSLSAELSTVNKEQEAAAAKAEAAKQRELDSFRKAEEEYDIVEKEKKEKAEEKRKEALEASREEFEENLEQQIEFDEIELERKRMKGESTLAVEQEILENRSLIEISQAKGDAGAIELIQAQKKLALDKLKIAEEKATKDKNKAELESTINSAAEAFGVTQEVAVAKMIMAAPEAVANSFKQAAASYAPPLSLIMGAVGAAGTIIPIVKGLSDIKKTRFSKSKGGSRGGSISTSTSSSGAATVSPESIANIAANNSARLGVDSSIGNTASATASANVSGSTQNNIVFSESKYNDFKNQVKFKEERATI